MILFPQVEAVFGFVDFFAVLGPDTLPGDRFDGHLTLDESVLLVIQVECDKQLVAHSDGVSTPYLKGEAAKGNIRDSAIFSLSALSMIERLAVISSQLFDNGFDLHPSLFETALECGGLSFVLSEVQIQGEDVVTGAFDIHRLHFSQDICDRD